MIERRLERWNECEMPGGQRRDANRVNAVGDGHRRHLFGRCKQRPDLHIEAHVGEGRRDDLLAAVMPVLADLGDQQPGRPAIRLAERRNGVPNPLDSVLVLGRCRVNALHRADGRCMAVPHLFQRQRDFAHRRLGARRIDSRRQKISATGPRHIGKLRQHRQGLCLIALGFEATQLVDLLGAHGGSIDFQNVDLGIAFGLILVDTDHRLLTGIDPRLGAGGGFLDTGFGDSRLDGPGHAAHRLDLFDMRPGLGAKIGGEALDEIAAAPRIDDAGRARFLGQEQLRVAGNARREIGGECERLVERIGVQRLRSALGCRHRLDAGACHVVEDILRRQTPAARLAMGAQAQRTLVLRIKTLDELGPEHAGRPHLRHFHEKVHADGPEERKPWREFVDGQTGRDTGPRILQPIGQRVGEFEIGGGSCLLHVIAGYRDRIELRHPLGCVSENIGDDFHRGGGRIDKGVPHHELLENVVLDRAAEFFGRNALFFTGHDIERHDRQDRAIHGHRHAHLVERNAVEQGSHVVDRIDGDTRHANVTSDARVIGIITAMRGEIEGDRQPHLPGGEIAAVEGIRIFRRGESCILPDGPGLRGVHRRVGTTQIRRRSGPGVEEVDPRHVGRAIGTFDVESLGRRPHLAGTSVHGG